MNSSHSGRCRLNKSLRAIIPSNSWVGATDNLIAQVDYLSFYSLFCRCKSSECFLSKVCVRRALLFRPISRFFKPLSDVENLIFLFLGFGNLRINLIGDPLYIYMCVCVCVCVFFDNDFLLQNSKLMLLPGHWTDNFKNFKNRSSRHLFSGVISRTVIPSNVLGNWSSIINLHWFSMVIDIDDWRSAKLLGSDQLRSCSTHRNLETSSFTLQHAHR